MSLIGAAAIGAGSSLLGGLFNRKSAKQANSQAKSEAQQQMAMQKEFAQNGIRWKVADAKAAGLSPLAALGASTATYSPVNTAFQSTSMGDSIANMGQDISRAVSATHSAAERKEEALRMQAYNEAQLKLQTENMGLQNDLIRQQIMTNKLQALDTLGGQLGPGLPSNAFRGPTRARSRSEQPSQGNSLLSGNGLGYETTTNQVPAYLSNDPTVRAGKVPAWIETTDGIRLLDSNLIEDQPWPLVWGLYMKEAHRQLKNIKPKISNKSVFPRYGKW